MRRGPSPALRPHRAAGLALGIALSTASVRAAPRLLTDGHPGSSCDFVDISAASSDCDKDQCLIDGGVVLSCGDLKVWADEAIINLGPGQTFAGAEARGNVILAERETLLACTRVHLGPDRIKGRIDTAKLHIKKDPNAKDAQGRPTGRDEFAFNGDMQRDSPEHWTISDANFTVCDCGDEPPSWRIDAREIDATLNDRATLYGPQLYINPFGLALLPITPPLLPLSVPLKKRALGFLAPQIRFFGPIQEPTLDIPFFVPLDDSWDLTLVPGFRADWGTHILKEPWTWAAPRLGGRLRYAPSESLTGEANVQWTRDPYHREALLYMRTVPRENRPPPSGEPLTPAQAQTKAQQGLREALTDRVSVDWKQRVDLDERLRWLVDASWLSDDLIQQDFRVSITERFADYLPSRTELLWRQPYAVGLIATDYLQRIEGIGATDYSNVSRHDRRIGQRGPALRLSLPTTDLGAGLHADADLSYVRYGPWAPDLPPVINLGGAAAGLSYLDTVGPVHVKARAGLDSLWLDPAQGARTGSAALTTDADAELPLIRGYGSLIHVLSPHVSYRGLPLKSTTATASAAVDERLGWETLHQGMVSLEQRLYLREGAAVTEVGSLSVSQPWNLESGAPLQTRVSLSWTAQPLVGGAVWSSLKATRHTPTKELGGNLWLAVGPMRVGGTYTFLTPQADRFRRSIYELAAAGPKLSDAQWVHSMSPYATLSLWNRFSTTYATDVLLRIPGPPVLALSTRKIGLLEHRVSFSYHSPCDCWDVGALLAVPAVDPSKGLRAQVTISIAGYALGTQ